MLVYISADHNGLAKFATADLDEMKEGVKQLTNKNNHVLVYVDTGEAKLIELKLEKGDVVENIIKEYGKRNSVGIAESLEVFNDVFKNPTYQADNYGLVYWSHGEGWYPYPVDTKVDSRWIGQDGGEGDNRMNISDFVTILQSAPHFDFLLFDCCFGQSVEVLYELRSFADYCFGSPTETPGPGAPYQVLVPIMFQQGNVARLLAEGYFKEYERLYDSGNGLSNSNWTAGVSVSLVEMKQLENLAEATSRVLPEQSISNSELASHLFDYDQRPKYSSGYVGYFDLVQMMQNLCTPSDYAIWKTEFDKAVVYYQTTPLNYSAAGGLFSMKGSNGLTQYILRDNKAVNAAYKNNAWYIAAGLSKLGW